MLLVLTAPCDPSVSLQSVPASRAGTVVRKLGVQWDKRLRLTDIVRWPSESLRLCSTGCQEDAGWPGRGQRSPGKPELEPREVVWGGRGSSDGGKVVALDLSSVHRTTIKKSQAG